MRAICIGLLLLAGCERVDSIPPTASVSPLVDQTATDSATEEADPADRLAREEFVPAGQPRDWRFLVLHHSATASGSVESIHETHSQRRDASGQRWRGIGYHFVIGNGSGMPDGDIEPTFRWREQMHGAHAGSDEYNSQGIGICLIGNFEHEAPTAAQMSSLRQLVTLLVEEYGIAPEAIIGHRDVKATACPGDLFPLEELRGLRIGSRQLASQTAFER